jgi:NADH-ubiquinone oxidoreductase chain 2
LLINPLHENLLSWYQSYYLNFALLIFAIGFLFKVSAAPLHFWAPDVYDSIPTIVTTFVAIIPKISIFILFLELVYHTNSSALDSLEGGASWTYSLLISSLVSLIIGTVVGLTQFRIKRLFAYSTISHLGFILLALSISTIESLQAFIFYLMQYSISNLNAFIILISIGISLYTYIHKFENSKDLLEKNNSPIQLISQLKGYFYKNPLLSLSLGITIFSFVGLPPLVGFFAKQMVLSAALDNGYIFLALIAILTSVVGATYYLNIIKEIFFDSSEPTSSSTDIYQQSSSRGYLLTERSSASHEYYNDEFKNTIPNPFTITIAIITILILFFIFLNKEWLSTGTVLVQILFNT